MVRKLLVALCALAFAGAVESDEEQDWLAGCTPEEVKAILQAVRDADHYKGEAQKFVRRIRYWEAEQDYPDEVCKAIRGKVMNMQWMWDTLNAAPRCSAEGNLASGLSRPELPNC